MSSSASGRSAEVQAGLALALAALCAVVFPPSAPAAEVVRSGALKRRITPDPWGITFGAPRAARSTSRARRRRRPGEPGLQERRRLGPGGARYLRHQARLCGARHGGDRRPARATLEVSLAPPGHGSIRVSASRPAGPAPTDARSRFRPHPRALHRPRRALDRGRPARPRRRELRRRRPLPGPGPAVPLSPACPGPCASATTPPTTPSPGPSPPAATASCSRTTRAPSTSPASATTSGASRSKRGGLSVRVFAGPTPARRAAPLHRRHRAPAARRRRLGVRPLVPDRPAEHDPARGRAALHRPAARRRRAGLGRRDPDALPARAAPTASAARYERRAHPTLPPPRPGPADLLQPADLHRLRAGLLAGGGGRAACSARPAPTSPYTYPAYVGGDGAGSGFTLKPLAQFDFTSAAGRAEYKRLLAEGGRRRRRRLDGGLRRVHAARRRVRPTERPGRAMHNRYPTTYHCTVRAFQDAAAANPHARPLVRFSRSGWTGTAALRRQRLGRGPDHGLRATTASPRRCGRR